MRREKWSTIAKELGCARSTINRHFLSDPYFTALNDNDRDTAKLAVRSSLSDMERMTEMVKAGKSYTEIGAELGISANTAQRRASRLGIKKSLGIPEQGRKIKLTADEWSRVKSYLDEGYGYKQVSILTNHAHETIANRFPQYANNGRAAQSMRMVEYHAMKKIDKIWGIAA